jgi:hypothetical protein
MRAISSRMTVGAPPGERNSGRSVYSPGARVGVAHSSGSSRARILEGNIPAARSAYQDFFALWKDADSDIPILKKAKAEYAKLQ